MMELYAPDEGVSNVLIPAKILLSGYIAVSEPGVSWLQCIEQ